MKQLSLNDIQAAAARLRGKAVVTPLLSNIELNRRAEAEIYIKPENLQHIGAFKFRGAYNRLSQFSEQQRQAGAVAFSSGNHAQGVALAAKMLGMPATIVMPKDAPAVKVAGTKSLGAEIRFYDRWQESREEIAQDISEQTGKVVVPAYDDLDIMAGQGTCGLECVEQLQEMGMTAEVFLCPVGGGGLIAGLSTAVKALVPSVKVLGVEPDLFDDHLHSKKAGSRQKIEGTPESICDALLAPMPGKLTWSVNSRTVDEFLSVTDAEVEEAVRFAFRYLKLVVEPGGAVALAALLSG
ncbi:MAG: threonine/serine dehydratase, partial [Gammaproteobacteria bacterium]|nr:threonine/serine dehydratase [Gammaproteobacteria bacterium]